jgi:thiamine biosynthesis lipoprotein
LKKLKRSLAALLCAALCLSLLAGCGLFGSSSASSGASSYTAANVPSDSAQRYSTIYFDVFDTVTSVIAYCDSQEEFDAQMDALHADLIAYNQLYDIYNTYDGINNLKTINDNAGIAPVAVDDRILDMLELAQQIYELTSGKMDVALGSVLSVWHNYREAAEATASDDDNRLPTDEELAAAAEHCDFSCLVIDRDAGTVYLTDPDMSLDVGSIGKGYAVEMVAQAAEARGLISASISVGGNLRSIGVKPGNVQWVSGVTDPWNASDIYTSDSSYLVALDTSDMALVTSGNYQRYYMVDGVRYHHLIDPDTLYPANYFDAVTILCADSGLADALSTGLFCMSLEEGQALIESLDGVEAMWCYGDREVVYSSGFLNREHKS